MTEYRDHELGDNAIDEFAANLYKHPESSIIKEAVTNGLDQQELSEAVVKIWTHVGDDNEDNIVIMDWGTGILDINEFVQVAKGYKTLGNIINSCDSNNSHYTGHKGLGKFGFLYLSKSKTVVFYSNRPEQTFNGRKYEALGMVITMRPKKVGGFEIEYKNNDKALDHPGVMVVIKDVDYCKVLTEERLYKSLQKLFVRKIVLGAKIYLNDKLVVLPDGYDRDEYPLFRLNDNTQIYGNMIKTSKPEPNNIDVFIKDIFVQSLSFEHKVKGWVNDNMLMPTSSRESIREDNRYEGFHKNLTEYLDAHFEKPNQNKEDVVMNSEKVKMDALMKLLLLQQANLKGRYDTSSDISGEILSDPGGKKREKRSNYQLTDDTGDPNADFVIPIGDGTKGGGPPIIHDGTGKGVPGIEGDGTHDVLVFPKDKPKEKDKKKGPIRPLISCITDDMGFAYPPSIQIDAMTFKINISWPQAVAAMQAKGSDAAYVFLSVIAPAAIDYECKMNNEILGREEWQNRFFTYVRAVME